MPTRSDNAKTLLDNLLTAVILMDERLCIQFVNPAAEQLLSLSERRLIGIELPHLLEHISLDLQRLKQCLVSGQGFTDSEVTLVVEGEPRLVELSATPMADHEQRLLVVELRKIDQQKKISQEQQQHAQQLAAKELVRGLAHEIKNPLGGLRGAAQLLQKELPDPALREYTGIIIEQADRLRVLVDWLLGPQRPAVTRCTMSIRCWSRYADWWSSNSLPLFTSSGITTPASPNSRWSRISCSRRFST